MKIALLIIMYIALVYFGFKGKKEISSKTKVEDSEETIDEIILLALANIAIIGGIVGLIWFAIALIFNIHIT